MLEGSNKTRRYIGEYYRIPANSFKMVYDSPIGFYKLNHQRLSVEHSSFCLIETEAWKRILIFCISDKIIQIPLNKDNRSVSNKLYLICPYCFHQRQHLYSASNTYGCRKCLKLHYLSQSECSIKRLARRIRKLRHGVWGNEKFATLSLLEQSLSYPKPKWMRWNTFNQKQLEITSYEDKFWVEQLRYLNLKYFSV